MYIGGRKCSEAWKFINIVKTNKKSNSPLQFIPTGKRVKHFTTLLTEHTLEYRQQSDEQAVIQIEGEVV